MTSGLKMASVFVNVSQGGRVVIPAEIRSRMGISAGDQVLLDWSEATKELKIVTRKQRLQQARDLVAKYANEPGESVVDELIQERREAAKSE